MMRHVQLDCKGRKKNSSNSSGTSESTISGQALANYLVDDEVSKENLPPNKKAKKEDPAKKDGASWAPQITNVRSTKAGTKLTARKSTGGKAPRDIGPIL